MDTNQENNNWKSGRCVYKRHLTILGDFWAFWKNKELKCTQQMKLEMEYQPWPSGLDCYTTVSVAKTEEVAK